MCVYLYIYINIHTHTLLHIIRLNVYSSTPRYTVAEMTNKPTTRTFKFLLYSADIQTHKWASTHKNKLCIQKCNQVFGHLLVYISTVVKVIQQASSGFDAYLNALKVVVLISQRQQTGHWRTTHYPHTIMKENKSEQ